MSDMGKICQYDKLVFLNSGTNIIGFEIDPNAMTATLPLESKEKLLHHVRSFCNTPKGGRRRSLKEFQALTGYLNWAFNVFPMLKPGLSNVYAKLTGKTNPHARRTRLRGSFL